MNGNKDEKTKITNIVSDLDGLHINFGVIWNSVAYFSTSNRLIYEESFSYILS